MRVTQSMLYRQTLSSIQDGQANLVKQQDALASGVRLRQAADDPGAMTRVMRNDDRQQQLDRFLDNIRGLESRYGIMDDELGNVTDMMHRARELLVSAGNGGLDQTAMDAIGGELQSLATDVMRIANTRDGQGHYLFAGNMDNNPPFAGVPGAVVYNGGAVARQVPIDGDASLADGLTGSEVFLAGAAGDLISMFDDFATVVQNTASPTRAADLDAALDRLDRGLEHVTTQRVFLGKNMQRVDAERGRIESLGLQLNVDSSSLRDTDYAQAVAEMSIELTSLEAARSTFSKIQGLSLFDYLR